MAWQMQMRVEHDRYKSAELCTADVQLEVLFTERTAQPLKARLSTATPQHYLQGVLRAWGERRNCHLKINLAIVPVGC